MKKHLLIAATALALALPGLSSTAFAESHDHAKFSAEDVSAFADAKIAGLKAGLKLTPAQEKNWPALETTLRDIGKARATRWTETREKFKELHEHHNVIEGLKLRSKLLAARAGDLEKLSDAAKPLYDSLDDAQKRRFHVLLHVIARGHGHKGGHFGGHDEEHGEKGER